MALLMTKPQPDRFVNWMAHKKSSRELLDHIGWDFLHVAHLWKERFDHKMTERGFPWHGEARGRLLRYIHRDGVSQAELVEQSNSTRQAVQQLLDELEQEGIVTRTPDPADARKKVIVLTAQGQHVVDQASIVKEQVEQEYQQALGVDHFRSLKAALNVIIMNGNDDLGR